MTNYDPFTFGNSKAAVNLASMLNVGLQDGTLTPAQTARISKYITKYQAAFKELEAFPNKELRTQISTLLLNSIRTEIMARKEDPKILTHAINVLTAHYKKHILHCSLPKP